MSNLSNKHCFKPTQLDNLLHSTTAKRSRFFFDKNTGLEESFLTDTMTSNTFSGVLPSQKNGSFQLNQNQTFKIPNLDTLPVKKSISNVGSINPRQSVKPNQMLKNSLKQSQQSKISLIPRPSFIISRKSLHGSRSAQLNARKELLKQMVLLHEYGLKEKKELKKSTPVKTLAGLTPKKTPRSGGYFILPEFSKKTPKVEDIRSPIQHLIRKEVYAYSENPTSFPEKKSEISPFQQNNEHTSNFDIKLKDVNTEVKKFPNQKAKLCALLNKCKMYTTEVNEIHEKLKLLDGTFENKIKDLPDYRLYNEFCFYKSKKEDLYLKLQKLEADFMNFGSIHTRIGKELEAYIKKKEEVLEKHINFHKDFERAVSSALEECGKSEIEEKNEETAPAKPESPKLRRSLRLSKIYKKNKFEEKSPLSKKLRKLDTKSRGIQKA